MPRKGQLYVSQPARIEWRELEKAWLAMDRRLPSHSEMLRQGAGPSDSLLKIRMYMWAAGEAISFKDAVMLGRAARAEAYRWVTRGYRDKPVRGGGGFGTFKADWKCLRVCMSLQARLVVEQVLFDLGRPWSGLVTGFQPVV